MIIRQKAFCNLGQRGQNSIFDTPGCTGSNSCVYNPRRSTPDNATTQHYNKNTILEAPRVHREGPWGRGPPVVHPRVPHARSHRKRKHVPKHCDVPIFAIARNPAMTKECTRGEPHNFVRCVILLLTNMNPESWKFVFFIGNLESHGSGCHRNVCSTNCSYPK